MQLATIDDIKNGVIVNPNVKKFDDLMNQQPIEEWVKKHPYIAGYRYLPIDKVETLMKAIFPQWKIEITGQGTAFNGVWVTVRVHYLHPVTGEWNYHDGIGAAQLQTKKGCSVADLASINNGALSMAFPLAKTVAIKDACDHFGNLFGANLNRRDVLSVDEIKDEVRFIAQDWNYAIEQLTLKTEMLSEKELAYAHRIVNNREKTSYKKLILFLESK